MARLASLAEAVASIPDGSLIGLGGNLSHRTPCAAVHELIRQGKRGLGLVKPAAGYDFDVLCGAGCVSRVILSFVSLENMWGMAPRFRAALESGAIEFVEHT
jgi:glutaconate CoA-transferase, subunit A